MDLLSSTLGAVGAVGEGIDKFTGGRAVRGTLAGKPRELLSVLPFSDTAGITNHADATSGRDLTDMYGLTTKGSNSFGSHAAGFVADNVLSPANWLGAGAAYKAAPTIAKGLTSGAKALTGLDLLDHVAGGAKKLGGFLSGDAGTASYAGRALPLPVDTGKMATTAKAANVSRPRRFSTDPAKKDWYQGDRTARFGRRFGGGPGNTAVPGGIPEFSLNDAIRRFAADESGSANIPIGEPTKLFPKFDPENDSPIHDLADRFLGGLRQFNTPAPHSEDIASGARGMVQRLRETAKEMGRDTHSADLSFESIPFDDLILRGDQRYGSEGLAEVIKNGGDLPPISVGRTPGGGLHVLDGHHRARGYNMAGKPVPSFVGSVSPAEAGQGGMLRFLKDESGALRLPARPDEGQPLKDWLSGVQKDYGQALGDTSTPVGRLKSLSDSAGAKVYSGEGDDVNGFYRHVALGPHALAVYHPTKRLIIPNMNQKPATWLDDENMLKMIESGYSSGLYSTEAIDHAGVHEIGHALHHNSGPNSGNPRFFDDLETDNPGLNASDRDSIQDGISSYGATNLSEFVAEKFARDALAQGQLGRTPYTNPSLEKRYGSLYGPRAPQSLLDMIRRFSGDESGYLRHAIPGVDPELANAMDGLGPQYPGGAQKLHDLASEVLGSREVPSSPGASDPEFQAWRAANPKSAPTTAELEEKAWMDAMGRTANPTPGYLYSRFKELANSPHADQLASEIPEGSRFLGAGAEGLALKSPDGRVIRIGDQPLTANERPDIPEMLQAFRVAQAGPYKVEHLPMVHPVAEAFDAKLKQAGRSIGDMSDPSMASESSIDALMAHQANQRMNYHHENMAADIRNNLSSRGFDPWDATTWNTGVTPEGKAIIFDGGAIKPNVTNGPGNTVSFSNSGAFAPKPTYAAPEGDLMARVMAAGGPEKVRESLRKGIEQGTAGQGVDSGFIPDLLGERGSVQDFLRSHGIDAGPDIGRASPASPQYAGAASAPPGMGKLYGTLAATAGGGALLAYLLSGSHGDGNPGR